MRPSKPVVVLAFANEFEPGGYLRKLSEEMDGIVKALESSPCEVVPIYNATLEKVVDVLQKHRSQIAVFHYGGHASGDLLALESGAAHARGLAQLLGELENLQLVFLNGCATAPQVEHLQQAGIPAIVATSEQIDDEVARNLAVRFYRGLAQGQTAHEAFTTASNQSQTQMGIPRKAYRDVVGNGVESTQWPWKWFLKKEPAAGWTLGDLANDPLFGLKLPQDIGLPNPPFLHLKPYQREHARIFFGRGQQIKRLYQWAINPGSQPILLFYGQSGVGKSSVLAAGVLPRLESTHSVVYARREKNLGLLGTLKQALKSQLKVDTGDLQKTWETLQQHERPTLMVLDQLEEAYTQPGSEHTGEVSDFFEALSQLFKQNRIKVLLGFRKEWLAEVERELGKQPYGKQFLTHMQHPEVMEAVVGLEQSGDLRNAYGLKVQEGLAVEIADDLLADPESPIAPVLQILLSKMWEQATRKSPSSPQFDQVLYRQLQGEGLLLGDFLHQQLEKLKEKQGEAVNSGLALDLLTYHTAPLGYTVQRTRDDLQSTYPHHPEIAELIQESKNLYLLAEDRTEADQPNRITRLAHDTLAPLVRREFGISPLPGQRARRILEGRAVEWNDGQKGAFLDEQDLKRVEAGKQGMRALNADEQRLLKASEDLQKARKTRDLRWSFAGGFLLLGLVVTFYLLFVQRNETIRQTLQKYEFGDQIVQDDKDYVLKSLILLKLNQLNPNSQTHDRLRDQLGKLLTWHNPISASQTPEARSYSVDGLAFNPKHRHLASASLGTQVAVWNLDGKTPQQISPDVFAGPKLLGRDADRVAYNSKGTVLAAGGWNGTIAVWHLEDEAYTLKCKTPGEDRPNSDQYVTSIALNPDGTRVVTGHVNGLVKVWSYGDDQCKIDSTAEVTSSIRILAVKFGLGGKPLAVSQNGTVWCGPNLVGSVKQKEEISSAVFLEAPEVVDVLIVGQADGRKEFIRSGEECQWGAGDSKGGVSLQLASQDSKTQAFIDSEFLRVEHDGNNRLAHIEGSPRSLAIHKYPDAVWIAVGNTAGLISLHTINLNISKPGDPMSEVCIALRRDQIEKAKQILNLGKDDICN